MRAVNYTFHSSDSAELDRVYEEYLFIGRNARRFKDKVVVYAYPRPAKKDAKRQPKKDDKEKPARTEQKSKRERWF